MSLRISKLVRAHSSVKGTPEYWCLIELADFADDNGRAWPKVSTLADRLGKSTRQVHRYLRSLVKAGEIVIVSNRGSGNSCLYQIQLRNGLNGKTQKYDKNVIFKYDTGVTKNMTRVSRQNMTPVSSHIENSQKERSRNIKGSKVRQFKTIVSRLSEDAENQLLVEWLQLCHLRLTEPDTLTLYVTPEASKLRVLRVHKSVFRRVALELVPSASQLIMVSTVIHKGGKVTSKRKR